MHIHVTICISTHVDIICMMHFYLCTFMYITYNAYCNNITETNLEGYNFKYIQTHFSTSVKHPTATPRSRHFNGALVACEKGKRSEKVLQLWHLGIKVGGGPPKW